MVLGDDETNCYEVPGERSLDLWGCVPVFLSNPVQSQEGAVVN